MSEAHIRYGKGSNQKIVELGRVTGITDTISTKTLITKTPMMPAEMQFGMDTGATESLGATIAHINGESMTNAQWIRAMEEAVNRWQAQTDGCKFRYIPDADVANYVDEYRDVNVYISAFSYTYNAGNPEVVNSNLSMSVGTVMGGKDEEISNPLDTFRI